MGHIVWRRAREVGVEQGKEESEEHEKLVT